MTDGFYVDAEFCTCCGVRITVECTKCKRYTDAFGGMSFEYASDWVKEHKCEEPGSKPKRTSRH